MTDHVCSTCGLKRPECGNKREQKEGYCRKWQPSSSSNEFPSPEKQQEILREAINYAKYQTNTQKETIKL